MSRDHVKSITKTLGDDAIAAKAGISSRAVRGWRDRGHIPPEYAHIIRELCDASSVEFPNEAFAWVEPAK